LSNAVPALSATAGYPIRGDSSGGNSTNRNIGSAHLPSLAGDV
jgi:hypothetical protein